MDVPSETRLALVHPSLAAKVRQAALILQGQGIIIRVVEGERSLDTQNKDYAQGRTLPGKIITDAKGGQSWHNYGLAVDLCPGVRGVVPWDGNWNPSSPDFKTMIDVCVSVGLEAGARWTTMKNDYDHFQMPNLPSKPTDAMVAVLKAHDVKGFWAQYFPIPTIG